jgi:stage II sporulation protein AA (anti-sigma F factor antagonist)
VADFSVTTERQGGLLRVVPTGELDIAAADALRAAIAERTGSEDLVIDLRGLEFMDTSGIQVVVEAFRAARDVGFRLRVIRAPSEVQRVFEIAGLDAVLPFED